jgi:hypothetical protein
MPYYRTETYTTTGTKGSWNLDPSIVPFNANIAVTWNGSGACSYKLQWTLNELNGPTEVDSGALWFDSTDIPAATAASATSALTNPVGRIRLVIATLSGGATLQMQARQGLSTN